MKIYLQILGTDTGDTTPSLLLFFDQQSYLFNCGEGTQRFCTEHKVRLAKVQHIFFSQLTWDLVGGLPGALLTLADIGIKEISLMGPKNTLYFIESCRYFLQRRDLNLRIREFENKSAIESNDTYKDENMKVIPIVITIPSKDTNSNTNNQMQVDETSASEQMDIDGSQSEFQKQIQLYSKIDYDEKSKFHLVKLHRQDFVANKKRKLSDGSAHTIDNEEQKDLEEDTNVVHDHALDTIDETGDAVDEVEDERSFEEQPHDLDLANPKKTPTPMARLLSRVTPVKSVICWACHMPDVRGKFNPKRAQELGAKPGPQFGILMKGENLTLADGTVIKPSDVMSPTTVGMVMLVVTCPTVEYLDTLVSHQDFTQYYNNQQFGHLTACIIHMTPHEVLQDTRYKQWMNLFSENVQHILVNKQVCSQRHMFKSTATMQIKMNQLSQKIFPKSYSLDNPPVLLDGLPGRVTPAEPLLKFTLSPATHIGFEMDSILSRLNEDEILSVFKEDKELVEKMAVVKSHQQNVTPNHVPENWKGVQLTFLGTGSAIPSKYRNVSANYLQLNNGAGILIDCGEGTYGQLMRRFGPQQLEQLLINLKAIMITHIHADHHLGTLRILIRRRKVLESHNIAVTPLVIVGPTSLRYWLDEYMHVEAIDFKFVDCHLMRATPNHELQNYFLQTCGLTEVFAVDAIHCHDSYAFFLKHHDGWKIVFSGDTRPCKAMIKYGMDATIVVHEATFEDKMWKEAKMKNHSTTKHAIEMALKMKARYVLMNHFSQRYPKIPAFAEKYEQCANIAFDLMTVDFTDFQILSTLLPALKVLFKEDIEER
jgi:ribonuclease Z